MAKSHVKKRKIRRFVVSAMCPITIRSRRTKVVKRSRKTKKASKKSRSKKRAYSGWPKHIPQPAGFPLEPTV